MYRYKVKNPIALFLFKRKDTVLRIIDQIRRVQPDRIYLLSDQGRSLEEKCRVQETRDAVEAAIDWPCEVIKLYAEANRGVYENIGLGAKRVFESEERAIFLEDDNYPEITFFNMRMKCWKDMRTMNVFCGCVEQITCRNIIMNITTAISLHNIYCHAVGHLGETNI